MEALTAKEGTKKIHISWDDFNENDIVKVICGKDIKSKYIVLFDSFWEGSNLDMCKNCLKVELSMLDDGRDIHDFNHANPSMSKSYKGWGL